MAPPESSASDRTLTQDAAREPRPQDARGERDRVAEAERRVPARYRIVRTLGAGASAVVLEAHDALLDRPVAIKVLDDTRQVGAGALVHEARAAAALRHPNVVAVYEADVEARLIVMELAPEGTLAQRIERSRLDAREVVALGAALAGALDAAHRAGILHRDLKPSNVLIAEDGTPRLADFGVAQREGDDGLAVGTRSYAAPEQLEGRATVRSDVYGLGAVLFAAVTGEAIATFEAGGGSVREAVRARTGSDALARALERMLCADPEARPASAAEAGALLLAAAPRGRRRAALVAIVVVLAAIPLAWSWYSGRERERRAALDRATVAVAHHDLDAAEAALADCAPDSPDAAYLRALVAWWRGGERAAIVSEIDRATALGLTREQREVLVGVRLLADDRLDDAVSYFQRVAADHPHPHARYGLFEALWHRGEASRALEVHAEIARDDPDFVLGLEHALAHHLAHGELSEVERILARSNAVPTRERSLWAARVAVARGDLGEAASLLEATLERPSSDGVGSQARRDLVAVLLARGDVEGAERVAALGELPDSALHRYAIAVARDRDVPASRRAAIAAMGASPRGSYVLAVAFATLELGRGVSGAALDEVERTLARTRKDDVRTRMIDLLLASARGDAAAVRAARESTSPEVAHAARALLADAAGELEAAAGGWERAAGASNDGTHRAYALRAAARLYARRGDHEATIRACRGVVDPPVLDLSSAPLVRQCLESTARAEDALGHADAAARARARLARLSR